MNSSEPGFAVIVLAAGSSTRMGAPKQLLPYNGRPLIRHAVETALATCCTSVVVVLGANAPEVRKALDAIDAAPKNLVIVENTRWAEGMGTSIQAGLRSAESLGVSGAILALADQPLITVATLERLVSEHHRTGRLIVASRYSETVGVPAWFARSHFPHLMALAPDKGCKGVIQKNGDAALLIDCPEAVVDIDTPSDYDKWLRPAAG